MSTHTGASIASHPAASPAASKIAWLDDEIDVQQYRRLLRRHALTITAGVVLGAIAGFIYAKQKPVLYEAATTLLVDQSLSPAAVSTSRALLENYTLASEVLNETGLSAPPHNLGAQTFVDTALDIEEVHGTNLVKVKVKFENPGRAADLANLLSKKAVELNRQIATQGNSDAREQLKGHRDRALAQLNDAEQRLLTYQAEAQVEVLESDTSRLITEREDLARLTLDIENERAKLAVAEAELKNQPPVLAVPRSVASDQAMLREEKTVSGSNDVDVDTLNLTNPRTNPVHEVLSLRIATARERLAGLERQRQKLLETSKVGAQQYNELSNLYRRRAQIARLQQEYDIASKVYDDLAMRYEQSAAQSLPTVVQLQIVDRAVPPARSLPRRLTSSTAAGAAAGLLLVALAVTVLDRDRQHTPADA